MKIAVDTMGGDQGPGPVCEAGVAFLESNPGVALILVGPRDSLEQHLLTAKGTPGSRLEIVNSPDFITPNDEPVKAIRKKKDSSMVKCLRLVREAEADAMVSLGNTGALLAGAVLIAGRIKGLERPALAAEVPSMDGNSTLLLDLGASVDARARNLRDYATMGTIYARKVLNRPNPTYGLMNVGGESNKGDSLRREAFDLLATMPRDLGRFVGNVEARDIFRSPADVVVTDGFVGNILLKSVEGAESALVEMMKSAFAGSPITRLGGMIVGPSIRRRLSDFDYRNRGGAVLLGVRSIVVKCHGSSGQRAVFSALARARAAAEEGVPVIISDALNERTEFDDD